MKRGAEAELCRGQYRGNHLGTEVKLKKKLEAVNVRNLTKMIISQATFGVRRPMSTTFVDIFKGYNFVVYTKIKFEEEEGQN